MHIQGTFFYTTVVYRIQKHHLQIPLKAVSIGGFAVSTNLQMVLIASKTLTTATARWVQSQV